VTGLQGESVDFGGLRISFDDRVLRPRTWTESQSRWAQELLPGLPGGDVLELCSGAGQIGLLAVTGTDRRLVCVDVNPVAAELTLENARRAGLGDRVEMRQGYLSEVLAADERFPLIIADPPWVPRSQTQRFPEDPLLAIDGGDDGLSVVRECLAAVETHLAEQGVALLQVGPDDQAAAVAELLEGSRLRVAESRQYGGHGALLRIAPVA
jgi:HemK-like putative methylase